ncbi:MAG: hypothetical protein M1820_009431 [Bogoriella megaspora]|nr:MAG: hypothetical protein M1820_009431 [Bogoriella megaspora]
MELGTDVPIPEKEHIGLQYRQSEGADRDESRVASPTASTQNKDLGPDPEKALPPPDEHRMQNEKSDNDKDKVDWEGSSANPHNWSWSRRIWQLANVAMLGWLVTFATSVYTPGYPQVAERFGVSGTAAILGLSLFTFGLGFGPVLGAPLSETFGRHIVYQSSLLVFMLFTLGAGFAQSYGTLVACRFLAGMVGGPVLAVGGGSIADLFPIHIRGTAAAFFLYAPFLGPALGPIIGGFVAQYENWRWTQWVILFAGVPIFLATFTISETYQKIIVKRLAKKQGKPDPILEPKGGAWLKIMVTVTLLRPLHMLFTEPIVAALSIYTAFAFAVLFSFFAAFPVVFGGIYSFDRSQTGLTFIAIGLGVTLGLLTNIAIDRKVYLKIYRRTRAEGGSMVPPEHRLYAAMMGSFGISIGLFWFAWTARHSVHWISPVIAAIPFAWGNLCVFVSTLLGLTASLPSQLRRRYRVHVEDT